MAYLIFASASDVFYERQLLFGKVVSSQQSVELLYRVISNRLHRERYSQLSTLHLISTCVPPRSLTLQLISTKKSDMSQASNNVSLSLWNDSLWGQHLFYSDRKDVKMLCPWIIWQGLRFQSLAVCLLSPWVQSHETIQNNINIHTFFLSRSVGLYMTHKTFRILHWDNLSLGVLQSHSFSCPSHMKAYCCDTVTSYVYQWHKYHIKLL